MQQENESQRSKRSPWIERGIFLALIAAMAIWLAYDRLAGVPHTILVDGKPVATLESRGDAKSVLDDVKYRQLGGKQVESPSFAQKVALRPAPQSAEIDPRDNAVSRLDEALVLKAQTYAIVVDDKVIIALPAEDDAYRALDLVKERFAQRLKNVYAKPAFKEQITVDRRYLPMDSVIETPEKAAEYLANIHDKPAYYTLKPGDRAVYITAEYGISLDELKKLNPGMDMNRLIEGDRLLVSRPKPPVTVITKALLTKVTPVKTPPVHGIPARTGKRQTWMVVTYENGREVSQEAIRVMTTWDKPAPKPTYAGKRPYNSYGRAQR